MKIIGIIPSRFASTRFPGKPLVDIFGLPMIQRVYQQALKARSLTDVIVATDDERIQKCILAFGGNVVMTDAAHRSGTDRCAEVVNKLFPDYDAAINIQGDEPHIHPEQIDQVAKCFDEKDVVLATLIKKIENKDDLLNPNRIKVVIDRNMNAIYFSRNPVPFIKISGNMGGFEKHIFYKHIGIYGYRVPVLKEITKLPPSSLEMAESLEQLRWVENGYRIKTFVTLHESVSIDAPEDLKKLVNLTG